MVPENLSVTLGERSDGAGQSARIGAEEQIDTILGQEFAGHSSSRVPLLGEGSKKSSSRGFSPRKN